MEVEYSLTDMVVLAFDSENGADQGRQKLVELNNQYVLNLVDAAEVVRHADGKVKVKNIRNLTGVGAMGGAFWGLIFGLLFFHAIVRSYCRSSIRRYRRALYALRR
jgi:uncharacterized membrane protein